MLIGQFFYSNVQNVALFGALLIRVEIHKWHGRCAIYRPRTCHATLPRDARGCPVLSSCSARRQGCFNTAIASRPQQPFADKWNVRRATTATFHPVATQFGWSAANKADLRCGTTRLPGATAQFHYAAAARCLRPTRFVHSRCRPAQRASRETFLDEDHDDATFALWQWRRGGKSDTGPYLGLFASNRPDCQCTWVPVCVAFTFFFKCWLFCVIMKCGYASLAFENTRGAGYMLNSNSNQTIQRNACVRLMTKNARRFSHL